MLSKIAKNGKSSIFIKNTPDPESCKCEKVARGESIGVSRTPKRYGE